MDPYKLSTVEATKAIKAGKLSATELVESCLSRIRLLEPALHSWAYLDEALPLAQARDADAATKSNDEAALGCMHGVPFGIKDVFNTADMPTQMGSALWAGYQPGNDARVVQSLRMEGGIGMGKTHTAEFAVHAPAPTRNPHNRNHSPGTSSSGSAVAVATGMIPLSLGTQTAGSTVRPASYCGIYGFKPSFGLLPRTAVLKTTDTLDHITLFARAIDDIRLGFDVMRVGGGNHPFVAARLESEPATPVGGPWRIAFIRGPVWDAADATVRETVERFAAELGRINGITVEEVDLSEEFTGIFDTHQRIYARALAYYFKEEAKQPDRLSADFLAMLDDAKSVSPEDYRRAVEIQARMTLRMEEILAPYHAAITTAAAAEAPEGLHGKDVRDNCLIWTFCGIPAINVPIFSGSKGLPFGLQVVARKYRDYDIFSFVDRLVAEGLAAPAPVVDVDPAEASAA